jgi:hypothetical protein
MPQRTGTKTVLEFLAENLNVDVSKAWGHCWGIHSKITDWLQARFPVQRHHSTVGEDHFTSPVEQMEGSFAAYSSTYRLAV